MSRGGGGPFQLVQVLLSANDKPSYANHVTSIKTLLAMFNTVKIKQQKRNLFT